VGEYAERLKEAQGGSRRLKDKRKAVRLLLADAEWGQWSDRKIARHCQVSQWFVSRLRKCASDNECLMGPRKVKRGATVYEMPGLHSLPTRLAGGLPVVL
jgi:hypothetical protein